MKRPLIPLLAFVVLLALIMPVVPGFPSTTAPGWHTTIFPAYFLWIGVALVALLFIVIGYLLTLEKADGVSWTLFALHAMLTLSAIIYLRFPFLALGTPVANPENWLDTMIERMEFARVVWILLGVAQVLFVFYYTRVLKTNRRITIALVVSLFVTFLIAGIAGYKSEAWPFQPGFTLYPPLSSIGDGLPYLRDQPQGVYRWAGMWALVAGVLIYFLLRWKRQDK
jgi:hypothetical protein